MNDHESLADAVSRLNDDVLYYKRQTRKWEWLAGVFAGLFFPSMWLVRVYYSAENRREIVCAKPSEAKPACRDHVEQDLDHVHGISCPHPDHEMQVVPRGDRVVLVKCLCR